MIAKIITMNNNNSKNYNYNNYNYNNYNINASKNDYLSKVSKSSQHF